MHSLALSTLVLAGLASASPSVADPSSLLAPDDPSYSSSWRPPASPTAGLKPFAPAETKDWLQMNKNVTPSGASMGGMSGMSGMSSDDMKGMKGMEKKPSAASGSAKTGGSMDAMPGMSGMSGMSGMEKSK
jgi:hypothetical protein